MLNEVARTIGWHSASDRETIIRREQIEQAIPSLQAMEQDLMKLCGRSVRKYIEQKGMEIKLRILQIWVVYLSFYLC